MPSVPVARDALVRARSGAQVMDDAVRAPARFIGPHRAPAVTRLEEEYVPRAAGVVDERVGPLDARSGYVMPRGLIVVEARCAVRMLVARYIGVAAGHIPDLRDVPRAIGAVDAGVAAARAGAGAR